MRNQTFQTKKPTASNLKMMISKYLPRITGGDLDFSKKNPYKMHYTATYT